MQHDQSPAGLALLAGRRRPGARSFPAVVVPGALCAPDGGAAKARIGRALWTQEFRRELATLAPGAESALRHAHTRQDEFVYVVAGMPTLVTDQGEVVLRPGQCVGFRAGTGNAHHLVNRSGEDAVYLEVGDRSAGDAATYPDDDLLALLGDDGRWSFAHKDGTPY